MREFPVKSGDAYQYPKHGMKVGNLFYKTSNMNYGKLDVMQVKVSHQTLRYLGSSCLMIVRLRGDSMGVLIDSMG